MVLEMKKLVTAVWAVLLSAAVAFAQVGQIPSWPPVQPSVLGAISVVNIGTNTGATGATLVISSVTVPAGALILVGTTENNVTAPGTVANSAGDTCTQANSAAMNGSNVAGWGAIFYCANSAGMSGGTITYTRNTSGRNVAMSAFYATNLAASPLDQNPTPTVGASTNPSVTSGTLSSTGELVVGMVSIGSLGGLDGFTRNGSFVVPFNDALITTNVATRGGNFVYSGTAPVTWAPVITSRQWAAFLLTFHQ